jgi:hypothetical protein
MAEGTLAATLLDWLLGLQPVEPSAFTLSNVATQHQAHMQTISVLVCFSAYRSKQEQTNMYVFIYMQDHIRLFPHLDYLSGFSLRVRGGNLWGSFPIPLPQTPS